MRGGKLPTGNVPKAGSVGSGGNVAGTINAGAGVATTAGGEVSGPSGNGAGTGAIMFDPTGPAPPTSVAMPVVELLLVANDSSVCDECATSACPAAAPGAGTSTVCGACPAGGSPKLLREKLESRIESEQAAAASSVHGPLLSAPLPSSQSMSSELQ